MSKNWVSDKLWRLAKVLYFLLSFLIILFVFLILVSGDFFITKRYLRVTDYVPIYRAFDRWKLAYYTIYTILWYTFLTGIFWRITHYIKTGSFRVNFNSSQIRRFSPFLWGIIILLIGAYFLSYKITNFCSGDHEIVNQYEPWEYRCDCSFWYKQGGSICTRASDQETFSGLNDGQIKKLLETVQLYTWDEKLQKMEELYKQVIWPISFKNEYMTWWVEYQTWSISISHPSQISINNNKFDEFKIYPNKNIYISKETFGSLVWKCIEYPWIIEPESESEKKEFVADQQKAKARYTKIFKEIMNGTIKEWAIPDVSDEYLGRFDPHSCWFTKWPINLKKISVDGINGVVIDYNATQDDSLDCITALFKEVLLVKNMDEIYRITFDYNFGRYGEMVIEDGIKNSDFPLENKWSYYDWEVCLSEVLNDRSWSFISWMEEFLKTWEWNANLYFKSAVDIINEIIKTIQIR